MARLDIAPYLERLRTQGAVVAELYWRFGELATEGRGPTDFWEDAPDGRATLMAFMNDPEVFDIVARVSGIFPVRGGDAV
ncbi:hypothetical protein [Caulobacter endophyticus]|uniref:Uncharacterized protein n=1 Tax=Caulobacter endophyticus TaxID=2172652 RepID=A0A2T9K5U5_9CAUL|nr:hypothetical protein [Caulobacter endophyticus]PVM91342.1 hypothetical protein DDF67_07625 [Caulobacter endophyticus]